MKPTYITVHCSATPQSLGDIGVVEIRNMHKAKGWLDIGYHTVIKRDGAVEDGRPLVRMGAHVKSHNQDNIGICLIGGVDENNTPQNDFTNAQFDSLRSHISGLCGVYGIKQENIKGHRDWFEDTNGDGVVDRSDWLKECPCFDVQDKLKEWER